MNTLLADGYRNPAKRHRRPSPSSPSRKRRRELEEGFNSIEDRRDERIRTIKEVAKDYLEGYVLRNQSGTFAEYAIGHLTRLLGATMIVDADEAMVLRYREPRLREKASPKTINEEVGFLLRLLGERGELIHHSAQCCAP